MITLRSTKSDPAARLLAPAMLSVLCVMSMASTCSVSGQSVPPTQTSPSSSWSPLASVPSDLPVPELKTAAQMEIEQEQLLLKQEQLVDNREDLSNVEPAVAHMNQSPLSVETQSVHRARNSGALEVSGGFLSNLYNRSSDRVASGFTRYSFPVGYNASTPRVLFRATYLPQLTYYSATNSIYQSHSYEHTLLYSLSGRTTMSWQFALAHFRDVGQFLPTVLPIGGTGIAQPVGTASSSAGTSSVSNVATSIALQHRVSPRDEFTVTGTGAWNELLQLASPPQPGVHQILRNEPFAADLLYEHALTPFTFVGAEGTVAYVRGLSTSTRLVYENALATLRYTPAQNDSFTFAAGPMVLQRSNVVAVIQPSSVTYAANAGYVHRSQIATISATYARIIQLSIDNTALPAQQISGIFLRPLTRHFDLAVNARYIRTLSAVSYPAQTSAGAGLRLDYSTGARLAWFVNASGTYAAQPIIGGPALNFNRTEISGGIRFVLGETRAR